MGIPLAGAHMANLIKCYRTAWKEAGHPGGGKVMLAFHMYCAPSREQAAAVARAPLNQYLQSIVEAASEWMSGVASRDYPNYQKTIEIISKETFELQVEKAPPGSVRRTTFATPSRIMKARLPASNWRRCR